MQPIICPSCFSTVINIVKGTERLYLKCKTCDNVGVMEYNSD